MRKKNAIIYTEDNDDFYKKFFMVCKVMQYWAASLLLGVVYSCIQVSESHVQHFCDPMDCTVHGILQARILEQVAVPFCRGSSQPREQIQVSCTAGGFFTIWATRETRVEEKGLMNYVSVGLEAHFWAKRYVLKMTNDMNTKKYY